MDENLDRGPSSRDVGGASLLRTRPAVTLVELLIVVAIIGMVVALLLPARRTAREPHRRNACQNNLKQIAIALKNYAEVRRSLPPAYTVDANGKPLHSWRTLILPFMEEQALYDSIDLTKPWDDPVNEKARKTVISTYLCPSSPGEGNHTNYLAVVTPNSCFRATEPRLLSDVKDPLHQTLMVIEVDGEHAVDWMSPLDADEKVVLGLGGPNSGGVHPSGMHGVFADGSVQFLLDTLPASYRLAMISIAGNDIGSGEGAE